MTQADHVYDPDRIRRLKRLGKVARLMDTAIRIPGTGIRFGGDSIVGLVPGIGDAGGALVGLWSVNEARRLGMPGHKLRKMVGNLVVDAAVGTVPVVGDIFDVAFKAHRRNFAIISEHFGEGHLHEEVREGREMKDVTPKSSGRR
ncbi:DUF4112 domain-containing protein [Fulvimarina sp. MAC3]|uniref:DUF4112 domain-containing protein n=1 Tax=Fulvimarina sp. MAC3 TaxID=3148887 RepID=UPI0031FC6224